MAPEILAKKAERYLQKLCLEIPGRAVGSKGNRAATDFFAETIAAFSWETASPAFDCLDWREEGVRLAVGGRSFEAFAGPYSPGCRVAGPLVVLSTVEELETADLTNTVALLHGPLAKEPLMPKNFPFYNPEEHQRIIHLLESKRPLAVLTATEQNPEMAGALYPFPLIEDGDFDIPSAYLTGEEGRELAQFAGQPVSLAISAERIPATGCNVIGHKGDSGNGRIVLFAHIDAKAGTPGAIDNAGGVTILLLLAEILAGYSGRPEIEIVALNGEDYYAAPGEIQYLQTNEGRFDEIILGINLDGAGYIKGKTAYSLYGCPLFLSDLIQATFSAHESLTEGPQWYQGDHGLFLMNQRPALAITSECIFELMSAFVHTTADTPEIISAARLVETAAALADLLKAIQTHLDQREEGLS